MKECFGCNIVKPLDEYYKHPQMGDGHLNKCMECIKKDVKERAGKLRNDIDWRLSERARGREKYHRLYRWAERTGNKKETSQKYFEKYPEKYTAKTLTWNAIKSGLLKKQPCEVCGIEYTEAHHDDYSKPLEVRWLCIKHHNEHHVRLREKELKTILGK